MKSFCFNLDKSKEVHIDFYNTEVKNAFIQYASLRELAQGNPHFSKNLKDIVIYFGGDYNDYNVLVDYQKQFDSWVTDSLKIDSTYKPKYMDSELFEQIGFHYRESKEHLSLEDKIC